jgi:RNA polymerase sigma-70 factor (ECF subfamily)
MQEAIGNAGEESAVTRKVTTVDPIAAIDFAEQRLILLARKGDALAFEQLYRRHVGRVHALCLRLSGGRHDRAEDATQETFLAAWRALPKFSLQSRFSTWLHRIGVNVVLQSERPRARRIEIQEDDLLDRPQRALPDSLPPLDLEAGIAALPDGARHVLVLVALYGYTHEETAAWLGIAEGTSKAQLNRARRLLTERLALEFP